MHRVLVVDVDTTQASAFAAASRWHVLGVTSALAALAALDRERWDVILVNPLVDEQVDLLANVRASDPGVVRLVLADNLDEVQALRVMASAHQFVPKPVDTQLISELLQSVAGLRGVLEDPTLLARLGAIQTLPSPAPIVWKLRWMLSDPKVPLERIVALVNSDPGLAAKLLSLANSAYFGARNTIRDTEHALAYLGLDMVRDVVLMIDVFKAFEGLPVAEGFSFAGVHRHALEVMRVVRKITEGRPAAASAGVAALLHDVGSLVLGVHLRDVYAELDAHRHATGCSRRAAELHVLGFSHAAIGAYLLSTWGLPASVVEAVAFHHEPSKGTCDSFDALAAVHIADCLVHEVRGEVEEAWALDYDLIQRLQLQPWLDGWRSVAERVVLSDMPG